MLFAGATRATRGPIVVSLAAFGPLSCHHPPPQSASHLSLLPPFTTLRSPLHHGIAYDGAQTSKWVTRISSSMYAHSTDAIFRSCSCSADYKNKGGFKQDDLRRRREEQQVEIRRQKREENISKRRNLLPASGADSDEETGTGAWETPVRCRHD